MVRDFSERYNIDVAALVLGSTGRWLVDFGSLPKSFLEFDSVCSQVAGDYRLAACAPQRQDRHLAISTLEVEC